MSTKCKLQKAQATYHNGTDESSWRRNDVAGGEGAWQVAGRGMGLGSGAPASEAKSCETCDSDKATGIRRYFPLNR